MFGWKFSCQNHSYRKTSKQGWLYALAILGQHKGNTKQIMKATKKLHEHYEK